MLHPKLGLVLPHSIYSLGDTKFLKDEKNCFMLKHDITSRSESQRVAVRRNTALITALKSETYHATTTHEMTWSISLMGSYFSHTEKRVCCACNII